MCSFKRIAVSTRGRCSRPLPEQVRRLAGRVDFFLLREKDLAEAEYEKLAAEVQAACRESGITLICHTFTAAAARIGCGAIHLPWKAFPCGEFRFIHWKKGDKFRTRGRIM